MSDTPRTDAIKIRCGFQAVPEPMLQHAYELERENAALRRELDWWHKSSRWLDEWAGYKRELEARKEAQP